MSASYLGMLIGSTISRPAIGWGGPRFGLVSAATSLTGAFAVIALTDRWEALVVARVAVGTSLAMIYVVIESQLNRRATAVNRGKIMAVYMAATLFGMVSGQPLLAITDPFGGSSYWLAAIVVLGAVPCAVCLEAIGSPDAAEPTRLSIRSLFGLSPLASVGCFCMGLSQGAFFGVGPAFGHALGLTKGEVGIFMLFGTLGGGIMQWPAGRLGDQVGRARTIAAGAAISIGVSACSILAISNGLPYPEIWSVFLIAMWGAATMPIYPLLLAEANDRVGRQQMTVVSARLILLFGFGAILGPFGATMGMNVFGSGGIYWFLATVSGIFCALACVSRRRRPCNISALHPEATESTSRIEP